MNKHSRLKKFLTSLHRANAFKIVFLVLTIARRDLPLKLYMIISKFCDQRQGHYIFEEK